MSTPKFQGYLIICAADDGEMIRAFKLERLAVAFVSHEHLRRWDEAQDKFKPGMDFKQASLYYFDLKNSLLLDTYSTYAKADGDAEGWRDAERNKIADTIGFAQKVGSLPKKSAQEVTY